MQSRAKVMVHRGIDLQKKGKFEEALKYYDQALEVEGDNPEIWNNRGVALFSLGKVEEALSCYDRAISLDPGHLEALRNRAFVLRASARLSEALDAYEKLISRGGLSRDHEAKAVVLVGLGRLEEAVESLKTAISMEPNPMYEDELEALLKVLEAIQSSD